MRFGSRLLSGALWNNNKAASLLRTAKEVSPHRGSVQ